MNKRTASPERDTARKIGKPPIADLKPLMRYLAKWAAERDHEASRSKRQNQSRPTGGKTDSHKGDKP